MGWSEAKKGEKREGRKRGSGKGRELVEVRLRRRVLVKPKGTKEERGQEGKEPVGCARTRC